MARRMQKDVEKDLVLLKKVALLHFYEKGFEAASIDEICLELGWSRGVVYHHFKDKMHLYQSCLEAAQALGYARIEAGLNSLDPLTQLLQWHILWAEEVERGEDFAKAIELSWMASPLDGKSRSEIDEELLEFIDMQKALIEQAVKQGWRVSMPSESLARCCTSFLIGTYVTWHQTGKFYSLKDELNLGLMVFLNPNQ